MSPRKSFPYVSKNANLIIQNAIILNIIYKKFNLYDIEIVICIILVLLKKADSFDHYLNNKYSNMMFFIDYININVIKPLI